MARGTYPFAEIEAKWQRCWAETGLFHCDVEDDSRPRYYALVMYPYPSGALHMGHVINYSIGDALVRFHLMRGENVLSPMGWDSFGLPAENAAIRDGIPPAVSTKQNIDRMREQMLRAGWAYDWRRELATSHPGYYKWTQWLFLRFYKAGLAFKKRAPVNWCPSCQTVLANEQVQDGGCERCGAQVEPRDLEQWFFAMSRYAQRLLDGHERLRGKWPERVLKMQQQWIGRSEGTRIDFRVEAPDTTGDGETLSVFTTRPDTTYGVTFMALAPEHPLVEPLLSTHPEREGLMGEVLRMRKLSALERTSETSEKEGIATGHHVVNPFDGSRAEIWVTNYALMEYGTGAVMGVPAHDQRDFLFARKYRIPIKVVIQPEGEELKGETLECAYLEDGVQVNSGPFDGMPNRDAMGAMTEFLKERGLGDFEVGYRLRDWLLSRQRYWGAPIPIIYCPNCGEVPVPEGDLPVLLPENVEFSPSGQSPLGTCEEFANTTCPKCGAAARRETDTMDTFVDSSWYFLRYLTPRDDGKAFERERCREWLPVHQYVGGIEHATMHLIYARFFTMVLHDLGLLDFDEPFERLFCQGMVCANAYRADCYRTTDGGELVSPEEVERADDGTARRTSDGELLKLERVWLPPDEVDAERLVRRSDGWPVQVEMTKMSKSKHNGVAPDELFERYGSDTVHTYILFVGPGDQDIEYSDQGVIGVHRFLNRFWELVGGLAERLAGAKGEPSPDADLDSKALRRKAHQTLERVTEAFEPPFRFNTAIASIMELTNELRDRAGEAGDAASVREAVSLAVKTLSPFAPHLCEEVWARLGHGESIFRDPWPAYDESVAAEEELEIPVQVNGRLRSRVRVPAGIGREALREAALGDEKIRRRIAGKSVRRVVVVPGRLVNIVVG